jgi:hypothetical protein
MIIWATSQFDYWDRGQLLLSAHLARCRVPGPRSAHMGMFAVKGQVYVFMGSSPVVISNPRSEPVSMT